jgi:hypothetical protein
MDEINCQPWTKFFQSAFLELDSKQLIGRIELAETAIDGRLHDLRCDSDHHAERQSMNDALRTLRFLRHSSRGCK